MQTSRLVVLAAGVGSRLQPKVSAKALVRVGGMTLLERSLVAAHEAGFDDIVVVTGHEPERVALEARQPSPRGARCNRPQCPLSGGQRSLCPRREGHCRRRTIRAGDGRSCLRVGTAAPAPGDVGVTGRGHRRRGPLARTAAGVEPADATKVRLTGDRVEAIGKMLPAYDAFDVGAFLCSAAVLKAVEEAAASGDTSFAAAVQVLAGIGTARALTVEADEWWFDVDTPTDYRRGSRYLFRSTGKALDGAVATRLNRTVSQRFVTPLLLRSSDHPATRPRLRRSPSRSPPRRPWLRTPPW